MATVCGYLVIGKGVAAMRKLIAMLSVIVAVAGARAGAADFWDLYARNLTYNYTVKSGAVPQRAEFGQRLSNEQMLSVIGSSFTQALGERVQTVANQRKPIAIVCLFTPEPQKCFADSILNITFDEVHFMNAPSISTKVLKKVSKYYSYTLSDRKSYMDRKVAAAGRVPAHKKFNPRFGFSLSEPEIVISTPFYTYFGIFVEPKLGTHNGMSLSLIHGRTLLDFQKEGLTINYRLKHREVGRGYTSLSISQDGTVWLSNEMIIK